MREPAAVERVSASREGDVLVDLNGIEPSRDGTAAVAPRPAAERL